MSEINFIMLNRFLDLKNLYVATKNMCLAQILKKILRILSFGGHLGRHLEYFNFPNDAKVASFSFHVRTYWRTHLCKNILCGLFFGLHPKSSFGNQTISNQLPLQPEFMLRIDYSKKTSFCERFIKITAVSSPKLQFFTFNIICQ